RPLVKLTLPIPGLNCHPVGGVKIRVWPVPAPKSPDAPSVMTMLPRAVKAAPLVELRALSAETLFPPVGEVMVTLAHSWGEPNIINPKTKLRRITVVFLIAKEPFFAKRAVFICAKESYLGPVFQQSGQPMIELPVNHRKLIRGIPGSGSAGLGKSLHGNELSPNSNSFGRPVTFAREQWCDCFRCASRNPKFASPLAL